MAPGLPYQINSNETVERHRQEPDIPMKELIAGEMYNRAFEHLYIKNSQYHDWLTGDKQQYPSLATYEFLDGIKEGLARLPDTPEKRKAQELCEGKLNALESETNIERSAWNKQKEMEKQARQKEEAYKKREAAAFEKYLEKTTNDIKRAGWDLTEEQIRGFVGAARYLKWDNGEFAKDKIDTPETKEYLQFIEDLRYGRTPQTPKLTLEDDPDYKQYITLAMIEHGHTLRASMASPSNDGRLYYSDPYQQEAHRQYVEVHNKLFRDAERQEDKFKEFGTTAEIAERQRRNAEDEARRQKQREEIAEQIRKETEEWRKKQNQGPTLTAQEKQIAEEAAYARAVEEFARSAERDEGCCPTVLLRKP